MPVEPGWYWFYGWRAESEMMWLDKPEPPALYNVKVVLFGMPPNQQTGHICGASLLYKNDKPTGYWKRIADPELPSSELMDGIETQSS